MTHSKKFFAAAALVAMASSAAVAQTDFGSPIGAGAGVVGSATSLGIPSNLRSGSAQYRASNQARSTVQQAFVNASQGGAVVANPAGGTVTLQQADARLLGTVLGGSASADEIQALATLLGGGPASTTLAERMAAVGRDAVDFNVRPAMQAYNAAIDALPAGATPSPALLAVRATLASIVQARANAGRR